jgi:hypothetical protein
MTGMSTGRTNCFHSYIAVRFGFQQYLLYCTFRIVNAAIGTTCTCVAFEVFTARMGMGMECWLDVGVQVKYYRMIDIDVWKYYDERMSE